MMKLVASLLLLLCTLEFGIAIIPSFNDLGKKAAPESSAESLPSLLKIHDIKELDSTWERFGNIELDTGRLIIKQPQGGIWSIPQLSNSAHEWTIELVFRSSGDSKNDLAFADSNGLSLWLTDSASRSRDQSNFGGPSAFDGFQFLINNKDTTGMKIFSNDGSKQVRNSIVDSIGECRFDYLDSQVPFTIRISYSLARNWFKVQWDNYLCFKTDKVKIPPSIDNFNFGVTGMLNPSSSEFFEVLRLSVWDHLTEDAIDDHGLMTDGVLKVDYKTVNVAKEDVVPPSVVRESLMERNRKIRQQMNAQEINSNSGNDEIVKKLADIEAMFRASNKDDSLDSGIIEAQLREIKVAHEDYFAHFEEFKRQLLDQFSGLVSSISKLNDKVIGEVREQQFTIDELSKKVDLLMNNHKEISHQYSGLVSSKDQESSSLGDKIVKWILIPILIGLLVLIVFIYRLRKDIKHSKLL